MAVKEPTVALQSLGGSSGSLEQSPPVQQEPPTASPHAYPKGFKLILIVIGLCLSVLCMALDNTIIATAVPRITDEFDSLQDIGWYGSAYLLTTCAFQLFYGKLYSYYNIKIVYLCGLGFFEAGSLICGVAPNSPALIVGRSIAGFGSAGLFNGVLLIIAHIAPVKERPTLIGIAGAMYGPASVAGPLICGAFTDNVTWRWCPHINLPLGALTVAIILLFLHLERGQQAHVRLNLWQRIWNLDPIGTAIFAPSIICLLLALEWGGTTYAWSDGKIIALLTVFTTLLVGFIASQLWLKNKATVPPRIMCQRTIAASSLFGIMLGAAFFQLIYFLPVWFQAIKETYALHSEMDSIPLVLSMTVGIILSKVLTTKFGYYMPFVIASSIPTSLGTGLITTFTPTTPTANWIGYQILFGFGCGLAFQLPQVATQAVLPLKDVAQGVSITFFAETLGGAIFVSIGNNLLNNHLVEYIGALHIPSVDPQVIVQLGATELRSYVPTQVVNQTIQAYNEALVDTFRIALIVACLSVLGAAVMEWRSVHNPVEKPGRNEAALT